MSHHPAFHLQGTDNTAAFDPHFTQNVIKAIGPKASPRMREVMSSLIKYVHDFARENKLTVEEWMSGVDLLNWAGKISDDKRNEGQLVRDVLGPESCVLHNPFPRSPHFHTESLGRLVDEITFKLVGEAHDTATASAILGPFFRHDAP